MAKKHENMDFCKFLFNLILLTAPSQESAVPMEFLESFMAAHNRHSTVVIIEKNSGRYKKKSPVIEDCSTVVIYVGWDGLGWMDLCFG